MLVEPLDAAGRRRPCSRSRARTTASIAVERGLEELADQRRFRRGFAGTRSSTRSQFCSNARASDRQRLGLDAAGRQQEQDRALELGVVEELVAERAPAPLELDAGADLVEHLDPRREPGLDRVLREEPLGERVQRADGGAVELVERRLAPGGYERSRSPPGRGGGPYAAPADAVAELGRRLLGEGDGGDRRSSTSPVRDEATTRSTSAVVLPDPAPASTNSVAPSSVAAPRRRRLGVWRWSAMPCVTARSSSSGGATSCDVAARAQGRPLALPLPAELGRAEPVGVADAALDPERRERGARDEARTRPPRCRRRSDRQPRLAGVEDLGGDLVARSA